MGGKKVIGGIFAGTCLALCMVPSVCMTFARTDTTTENKRLTELPSLTTEEGLNTEYMSQLGDYFQDHFAFRQELVNADSEVQSKIFQVSNVDTVIRGTDGWLYYTATLDNYLGVHTLSERTVSNIAHNLKLLQDYVQAQGAQFLFTAPANKNTLYGDNMPYYDSVRTDAARDLDRVADALKEEGVRYLDLFSLFSEQDEVLYLKRDSHWNNRGALLAYNAMMDTLGIEHEDYSSTPVTVEKKEIGDLNSMLYPLTAEPEDNYYYQYEQKYTYMTPTKSVEDAVIQAQNPEQKGSLVMYRDSFGNTLLPFFAQAFGKSYFSKGQPFNIAAQLMVQKPDTVIVEKVERNLKDLAELPPVLPSPSVTLTDVAEAVRRESGTTAKLRISESNATYYEVTGIVDGAPQDAEIYVRVTDGERQKVYDAFRVSGEGSDYGYLVYLPTDQVRSDTLQVDVLTKTEKETQIVKTIELKTE